MVGACRFPHNGKVAHPSTYGHASSNLPFTCLDILKIILKDALKTFELLNSLHEEVAQSAGLLSNALMFVPKMPPPQVLAHKSLNVLPPLTKALKLSSNGRMHNGSPLLASTSWWWQAGAQHLLPLMLTVIKTDLSFLWLNCTSTTTSCCQPLAVYKPMVCRQVRKRERKDQMKTEIECSSLNRPLASVVFVFVLEFVLSFLFVSVCQQEKEREKI